MHVWSMTDSLQTHPYESDIVICMSGWIRRRPAWPTPGSYQDATLPTHFNVVVLLLPRSKKTAVPSLIHQFRKHAWLIFTYILCALITDYLETHPYCNDSSIVLLTWACLVSFLVISQPWIAWARQVMLVLKVVPSPLNTWIHKYINQ